MRGVSCSHLSPAGAQPSAMLPPDPTSVSVTVLEGPCLPVATSAPSEPHTCFWLNPHFCGFTSFAVQVDSRPSPRPAGGSPTWRRRPREGRHLWHPEGGVSGRSSAESHASLLSHPASFPILPSLSPDFPHLCHLFPPLTLAFVLFSSRSPESETSVRRKVSLVLEQMQPLVSGLMVGAKVRLRALGASGAGCGLASFPPCL